jgi:hypothetical protein
VAVVSMKFAGSAVLVVLSVGLAAAFIVLWPKPVSVVLAGMSLLCGFGALLAFCRVAGRKYSLQAQRIIFLASGCFGLAFVGLAWKYREGSPAFSLASIIVASMLCLGALASYLIVRSASQST